MGCWCYHMIFHHASSVWLAWLQSLSNSCSLLTTRFFILFFSPRFSILPLSFGVLIVLCFIWLFILEINQWRLSGQMGEMREVQFRLDLGVKDRLASHAAPVHFTEDVMRVEEDGGFMERWRHHSDEKCRFAGTGAGRCLCKRCLHTVVGYQTHWLNSQAARQVSRPPGPSVYSNYTWE